MELIIAELSRYVLIILFAFYTLFSFRAFSRKTEEGKNAVWHAQRTITVLILLLCGSILIMETKELRYLVLLGLELVFYVFFCKDLSGVLQGAVQTGPEQYDDLHDDRTCYAGTA